METGQDAAILGESSTAYVDRLCHRGWVLRGRRVESCHLIAETLDLLHRVAKAAGCKRAWFQPKSFPHYDLTASRRAVAITAGAVPCDRRELVGHLRRIRAFGARRIASTSTIGEADLALAEVDGEDRIDVDDR